jgi:acetyl-CoA carboxylase biotin carboxyl carrier protein
LDIKEIKALIDLMKKNDLSVFKMEKEGFKITLERNVYGAVVATAAPPPLLAMPVAVAPQAAPAAPAGEPGPKVPFKEILSPMVGTFYRAPSPESPNYAEVGQEVTEETVVCIIEAMKMMNEIKAEVSGVIAEVLVENGTPVQFGQTLFKVR